jgi:hypothetical protein
MRFAVIENREWSGHARTLAPSQTIHPTEVDREARRRKALLGLDEWRVREYVTGISMPSDVRNMCLQIDYAAQALARLSPIPADFSDDVYWPRMW